MAPTEPSPGDWIEDFEHENGRYMDKCVRCKKSFSGHKRRVICKVCDTLQETINQIGERLRTQDNRTTEAPIFLVQTKRRIYGMDTQYADTTVWIDEDGNEVTGEEETALDAKYDETGEDNIDGCTRTSYVDIWEFATACMTHDGAQRYIDVMAHRLNEPRIYVDSGYRNEEWIALRAFLKQ